MPIGCTEKKERLTPKTVYRLQKILYQNIDAAPRSSQSKKDLAVFISSFNQKIKENAHPFEQCFLFYEAFLAQFPEAGLLAFELFSRVELHTSSCFPLDLSILFIK